MRRLLIPLVFFPAACGQVPMFGGGAEPEEPQEMAANEQVTDPSAVDPSTRPPGVAARAPDGEIGQSGRTLATLGNANETGQWLKTPLVSTQGPGRITSEVTGRTIDVLLIPLDGPVTGGSRISVAAMLGLGLELTSVAALTVEAVPLVESAEVDVTQP